MKTIDYYKVASIDEALEIAGRLLSQKPESVIRYLAGGTDLVPLLKDRGIEADALIEITDVEELKGIEIKESRVHIHAGTTHAAICASRLIREKVPVLYHACRQIGSVQIRNRGTIGGNLANASPAGDSIPSLLVLDAKLHIASPSKGNRKERIVDAGDFASGAGVTVLHPGEILTSISFDIPENNSRGVFLKLGQRQAMTISKVSLAVQGNTNDGKIEWIKIAFGAVACKVMRARRTESLLTGKRIDDASAWDAAIKTAKEEVSPIDDIRSTSHYRREMCGVLLRRAISGIAVP